MAKLRVSGIGGGITKAILLALGTGAIIGIALLFPGVGYLYKEFTRARWNQVKKRGILNATIRRLERQKLISWKEVDGQRIIQLTERGKKKVLQYNIDNLKLNKQEKWDGSWRVIVFDVPEKKRVARDLLRKKLKEMKFYKWQKSVFLTPWECKDEIDFLRHTFEIAPYVQYVLAKEILGLDVKLFKKFERVL